MASSPDHDDPAVAGGRPTGGRSRRRLWVGLGVLLLVATILGLVLTWFLRQSPTDEAQAYPPPWGGGYVTGLAWGPDGALARTDVGGAYRWDATAQRWSQVMNASAVAARPGASSVLALAPSGKDGDLLLAAVGMDERGGLIRSPDGGDTWKAAGPAMYVNGNEDDRVGGSRLAHVGTGSVEFLYGSQKNGLMSVASDGSVTPVALPGVPGTADVGAVGAHPTTGVWAGVNGVGLFHSTDGRTFTKVVPAKTGESYQKIVPTEAGAFALLMAEDKTRRLDLVAAGATQSRALAGGWTTAEAFDATPDGRRVIVIDGGAHAQNVFTSADGGQNWRRATASFAGLDGSWAQILPEEKWLSIGDVHWDPKEEGRALLGEGSGAFEIRDATSEQPTYQWASAGIRELVTNDLVVTPAGTLMASWDRPVFLDRSGDDGNGFSQVLTTRFNSAWSLATAPNDGNVVAAVVDDRRGCCTEDGLAQQSALSTDGGLTWTRFGSLESGTHPQQLRFGTIAVGHAPDPTLLWEASDDAGIWRSTDQGRTWTKTSAASTGHHSHWLRRHTLIADPTRKGTFWSYQADGLLKSTDDGVTWKPVAGGEAIPPEARPWNARLLAVPGMENGLIFSSGPLDEGGARSWLTTDGGATWKQLSGADGANYITVVADGDHRTMYTIKPDQKNVLASTDDGTTWTAVPGVALPFQPSDITDLAVRPGSGGAPASLTVSYAGNTTTTVSLPKP